eukprot:TRINITY_DN4834_c0_g1_i1.p1 TRINITY_DN4834_c0_g1~~TRINITY_DN4834_c0_g1_i1.p1  ORF type:complete len:654 (-),score=94.40 TRINITY_DN4834_c0_g1_i1:2-1963(-)
MRIPHFVVKERKPTNWWMYSLLSLTVCILGLVFTGLMSHALGAELDMQLETLGSPSAEDYRRRQFFTPIPDTTAGDGVHAPFVMAATAAHPMTPHRVVPDTSRHLAPFGRRLLAIEDSDTSDASDTVVRFKRSVGRRNFKFEKVSSDFRPYDQDYRESMIMLALPGLFFAVGSVIFGLVFCCCRKFDKCGGKSPREQGYTGMQRNLPKIVLFLCFIGVAGMCALGYIGNFQTDRGLKKFFDIVVLAATQVSSQGKRIVSTLERLENTTFPALQAESEAVETVTLNARDEVLLWNLVRLIFINVGLVGAFLVTLAGMWGLLCGSGTCAYMVFVFGIPVLFITWISFAVHLPGSIMIADLCPQIDQFVQGDDAKQHPAISIWVSCFQNASFGDTFNISQKGVERKIGDINRVAPSFFINGTIFYNTSQTAYEQLETLDDQLVLMEDQLDDNIDAGRYPDDQFPESIDPFGNEINDFRSYARNLRNIKKMESCETQRNAFNQVKLVLCLDVLTGADLVLGAQGFIGCILFFAVWMGILGKKRFPPENKFREYHAGLDLEKATGPKDFIHTPGQPPAKAWGDPDAKAGSSKGKAGASAGAGAGGSRVAPQQGHGKQRLPPVSGTDFRAHAQASDQARNRQAPAHNNLPAPRPNGRQK